MEGRNRGVELEDLTTRGPLMGLFLRFKNKRPTYSLSQALERIVVLCEDEEIGLNPIELRNTISFCEEKGEAMCGEEGERASVAEIAALALYTAAFLATDESFYDVLNCLMREKDRHAIKPFAEYIWLLMWGLRMAPASPAPTVYRGVKLDLSRMYPVGATVCWHQFASCTWKIEVQRKFLGKTRPRTLFTIELTTQRGKMIRKYSQIPEEEEVLLPANSMFEVVSVLNMGERLHMIQLKEVPPKDPILVFEDAVVAGAPGAEGAGVGVGAGARAGGAGAGAGRGAGAGAATNKPEAQRRFHWVYHRIYYSNSIVML